MFNISALPRERKGGACGRCRRAFLQPAQILQWHRGAGESGAAGPRISVAPPARPPIRYAPETNNILAQAQEEHVIPEKLISGDNPIDLTYCRPDLWSSAAPNK